MCVCFIFHKFHYEFSSYSSGGSRRREEQEKQQPAELVGNAYDNNAEINHTWGTKMSALSVVSTMRFVQTLNIRFGHAWGWGGSTRGSSVGKSSLLLRLSQGNRNVYCQQAKVVVVGGAGGGASSACRVGHGSLGAQNHLRLYVFYGPRRQPRLRPSPVIASKTVGVWGGCLLHSWRRTS